MSKSQACPKFSKEQGSMYGLDTYWTIKYSEAKLKEFNDIIEKQGKPGAQKKTDKELWDMKYAVSSNLHPQLMKPINILFRLNTFICANIPLGMGMALLPPTPLNQIMSQGLNQSYNFAFNYCNRNTSNPINMKELKSFFKFYGTFIESYVAAVATSIVSSAGMAKFFEFLLPGKGKLKYVLLNYISPYAGCAFASLFNLYFARAKDLSDGINILHPQTKKVLGVSKLAGKRAFMQSMCMRLATPAACILMPKYIDNICRKYKVGPVTFLGQQLFGAAITGVSLYVGLSFSLPVFPQLIKVQSKSLEDQFKNIKDAKGKQIEYFYYDKGL